jgi:hypothetical protein
VAILILLGSILVACGIAEIAGGHIFLGHGRSLPCFQYNLSRLQAVPPSWLSQSSGAGSVLLCLAPHAPGSRRLPAAEPARAKTL